MEVGRVTKEAIPDSAFACCLDMWAHSSDNIDNNSEKKKTLLHRSNGQSPTHWQNPTPGMCAQTEVTVPSPEKRGMRVEKKKKEASVVV
jgi:hypothetical protein